MYKSRAVFFTLSLLTSFLSNQALAGLVGVIAPCNALYKDRYQPTDVRSHFRWQTKGENSDVVLFDAPGWRRTKELARLSLGSQFRRFHESTTTDNKIGLQLLETDAGLVVVAVGNATIEIKHSWTFADLAAQFGEKSRLRYATLIRTQNESEPGGEGAWGAVQRANVHIHEAMGLPKPVDLGESEVAIVLVFDNGLSSALRLVGNNPVVRRFGNILPEGWDWSSVGVRDDLQVSPGGKMIVLKSGTWFSAVRLCGASSTFLGSFHVPDPIVWISADSVTIGAGDQAVDIPTGGIHVTTKSVAYLFQPVDGRFKQVSSHKRWPWARWFD